MKTLEEINEKINELEKELEDLKIECQRPFRKWLMVYQFREFLLALAKENIDYEEKMNIAFDKFEEIKIKTQDL